MCVSRAGCHWYLQGTGRILDHRSWNPGAEPRKNPDNDAIVTKGSHVQRQTRTNSSPNSRRSPKRGQKSATSPNRRENDRMSASTHETAARTQFIGPLCMSRTLSSSALLQSMSPKTLLFRSFHGVFDQRCRILRRVASVPQKSSRHRRESVFSAPTHAGPQGERSKKVRGGLFWPRQEVQKWHFSRVIGAQKRAPHRRKTHPQKWCAKNGPK